MKKILFAIIGLVLLAISGVAIYVGSIDWNEHKTKISEQFSALTGKKVVFSGDVELKFFPYPYLTVENVKIYSDKTEIPQPLAEIEKLVAELELLPFLKGEFNVQKMIIEHPVVRVKVLQDGKLNWFSEITEGQQKKLEETPVKLDQLTIDKAELIFINEKLDIDWRFTNLSAVLKAETLMGPFHVEGSYVKDNQPSGFALSIGKLTNHMNTTLNVVVNNPVTQTMFRFDGSILPQNNVISGNIVFDSKYFKKFISDNFKNIKIDDVYDMPLAFSTQINNNIHKLELSNLVIKYGKSEAAGNVIVPWKTETQNWNDEQKKDARNAVEMSFNFTHLDLNPWVPYLTSFLQKYKDGKPFEISPKLDAIVDLKAVNAQYQNNNFKKLTLETDLQKQKIKLGKFEAELDGKTILSGKTRILADENQRLKYMGSVRLSSQDFEKILNNFNVFPTKPVPTIYKNFEGNLSFNGNLEELNLSSFYFVLDKMKFQAKANISNKADKKNMQFWMKVDQINLDNYIAALPDSLKKTDLEKKIQYYWNTFNHATPWNIQFNVDFQKGNAWGVSLENGCFSGEFKNNNLKISKLDLPHFLDGKLYVSGAFVQKNNLINFQKVFYRLKHVDITKISEKLGIRLPKWDWKKFTEFYSEGLLNGDFNVYHLDGKIAFKEAQLKYSGQIDRTEALPKYIGQLQIHSPDFLKLLHAMNIHYEPNVYSLGVLNLNSKISGYSNDLLLTDLDLFIGQNNFSGELAYLDLKGKKELSGQLNINHFEPDRFFYNGKENSQNKKVVAFKKEDLEKAMFLRKTLWNTMKINYDLYRKMNLNLLLYIAKIPYSNFIFENSHLNLVLANQELKIENFKTDYNRGELTGNCTIAFDKSPTISGNLNFKNVNLDDDFWQGLRYGFVYGTINSNTQFSAHADSVDEMIKTWNSTSKFEIKSGRFKGFDLEAIEEDLKTLKKSEGLKKIVEEHLQKGDLNFASIKGIGKVENAQFHLDDVRIQLENNYNLELKSKGNLKDWTVDAQFVTKMKNLALPAWNFSLKGGLNNPVLAVNVDPILELYQKEKAKKEAYKRHVEEERQEKLQKLLNEKISVTKVLEKKLNPELKTKFKVIEDQVQNQQNITKLRDLKEELDNIGKGIQEVVNLGVSATISENQIRTVSRRNGLLRRRIEKAEKEIEAISIDDLKFRTNQIYHEIMAIYAKFQGIPDEFRQTYSSWQERLSKIEASYDLLQDSKIQKFRSDIYEAISKVETMNERLEQEYAKIQNTFDWLQLTNLEENIQKDMKESKIAHESLHKMLQDFYLLGEQNVETAENFYKKSIRDLEVKRKLKENIGSISVAGGRRTMRVTRNIEEIEKSENLKKLEDIPVLDFTKKKEEKRENIIIRDNKEIQKKEESNLHSILHEKSGKLLQPSGVIVRK